MTKKDYRIYIKDILKNMETAEGFLKGMLFEDFAKDRKTSYAVVRCRGIVTNTDTKYRGRWIYFDRMGKDSKKDDFSNWKDLEL